MADTVFVDKQTVVVAAWMNDVNNLRYGAGNAARGAALLQYMGPGAGAATRTQQDKTREAASVNDYWDLVSDATTATQAAITANPVVKFIAGYTYNLTGDITIPSNRTIIVEKGATVINTGGRFTSYNTVNVEWEIHGKVQSVAMATAPDKTGWAAGERGFLEFGMAYSAGQASSGFWVHGTGEVSGDWTGTPNFSDPTNQINRKGIACWNSANVLVEGLEVFGFDGEAVYAYFFDTASLNIVFRNNNVHNTRFNALNFNAAANGGGCSINHNRAVNTYQIEISAGDCSDNYVDTTPTNPGIYTGLGTGYGPLTIKRNVIKNAGLHSIGAAFASGTPVTDVFIEDNVSINPGQYGVYTDYCNSLTVQGNVCIGTGQTLGAYDVGVNHCSYGVVANNIGMKGGVDAQPGGFSISTSTDVVQLNNTWINTTGASPVVAGGAPVVASAATIAIPTNAQVVVVSGTTNITSVTATNLAGSRVTLVFQGILTFTDGSNLKLAGNFTTAANATISLVCDGTNWYETGRSTN